MATGAGMAKIEDLITEIADTRLWDEIPRAVATLNRQKEFSLVFEEHIPEQTLSPGPPVNVGLRRSTATAIFRGAG
jgi:hypothetical protein